MGALRKDRAVQANAAEVRDAVDAALGRGNAVDAVCTGLLVACARDASVAFGSVSLLVAGFGMSPRRIDGRVLQPGNRAKRPRGFRESEAVPSAAYVANPRLFATVGTALTLAGRSTYAAATAPALAACSDEARRGVLEAFAALGPALFQKRSIAEELRAAAGPAVGGSLCDDDFTVLAPSFTDFAVSTDDTFAVPALAPSAVEDGAVEWIGARDATGLMCLASFERAKVGHEILALGLVAPRVALPVRRGVQRVDPTVALGLLPPARAAVDGGQLAAVEALEGPVVALAAFARGAEPLNAEALRGRFGELEVVRLARA
jgi:hypothetical protein